MSFKIVRELYGIPFGRYRHFIFRISFSYFVYTQPCVVAEVLCHFAPLLNFGSVFGSTSFGRPRSITQTLPIPLLLYTIFDLRPLF